MTAIILVGFYFLVLLVGIVIGWLLSGYFRHSPAAGPRRRRLQGRAANLPTAEEYYGQPDPLSKFWPEGASAALGPIEQGGGVIHRPVSAEPSGWPLGEFTPGSDCEILLVGRDLESDREDLRTWALATVKFVFTQTFDGRPRFICEKWGGFGLVMVDPDEIRPKGGASATI